VPFSDSVLKKILSMIKGLGVGGAKSSGNLAYGGIQLVGGGFLPTARATNAAVHRR